MGSLRALPVAASHTRAVLSKEAVTTDRLQSYNTVLFRPLRLAKRADPAATWKTELLQNIVPTKITLFWQIDLFPQKSFDSIYLDC
jgi:hypothetical protein